MREREIGGGGIEEKGPSAESREKIETHQPFSPKNEAQFQQILKEEIRDREKLRLLTKAVPELPLPRSLKELRENFIFIMNARDRYDLKNLWDKYGSINILGFPAFDKEGNIVPKTKGFWVTKEAYEAAKKEK